MGDAFILFTQLKTRAETVRKKITEKFKELGKPRSKEPLIKEYAHPSSKKEPAEEKIASRDEAIKKIEERYGL